ncbi:MAG: hypothetical protein KGI38_04335 [Thaumarchaeota archaeon]|nr:hypothetical protein [Nitrososphaerota archaeon]
MQRNRSVVVGAFAFASGCAWVALESIAWYFAQGRIGPLDQQSALALVLGYYATEALAIGVAVVGAFVLYRGLVRLDRYPADSIGAIISDALSARSDLRVGILAGGLYGLLYLFAASIVVYQPSVDFQSYYGVSAPGIVAAVCCGAPGTVPYLKVYLLPQAHLALQILPLDALFAVVIPLLVGLNVAVAVHALRNKTLRSNAGWLGSVGVMAGLFTGCPTCAGLFLAGAVGGLGATSLAVALAPYQMLFVVLSIPVLLASPVVVAVYAGKAARAACAIPAVLPHEMLKKS